MSKGWMYILECSDGSYYTGSTKNLERRLAQHSAGKGANHTKKKLPIKLVYFEEFSRVDKAFYREKQVQGWSRKKKEALINNMPEKLHELAKCLNETSHINFNSTKTTDNGVSATLNPQATATLNPQNVERSLSEAETTDNGVSATLNPQAAATLNPQAAATLNPQAAATLNPQAAATLNPQISTAPQHKGIERSRNVPALRFPEFENDGEWEAKEIGQLFRFKQGVQVPIKNQHTKKVDGMVRFIRIIDITGSSEPPRYINNPSADHIINENDLFMIRYGTPGAISIGFDGVIANNLFRLIWKSGNSINPLFWYYVFQKIEKNIFSLSGSSSMPAISFSTLDNLEITFPNKPKEQQKIASCLSSLDELITAHNEKLEALKTHKKGLMQNLFPQKGQKVPNYRFPEFVNDGEWEEKFLGKVCGITTGRLDANAMIPNGKFRFYTCARDFYYIDNYAFDTEALLISGNGANVGYIHYYKGKFNAYQRTYVLDDFSENIIYLKYYLEYNLSKRISIEKRKGNTPYIVKSTLSEMEVFFSINPKEQQKIASCLSAVDELITTQTEKIAQLQQHKKGLMQQLFPNVNELAL